MLTTCQYPAYGLRRSIASLCRLPSSISVPRRQHAVISQWHRCGCLLPYATFSTSSAVTSTPTPFVRSYSTQQAEIVSGASKHPSESEHAPAPTQATPADSRGDKTSIRIRSPLKKRNDKSGRVHKVLELKVDTISLTKVPVVDLLAKSSGLSKVKVKEAMIKGAVWQHHTGAAGKILRVRRAQTLPRYNDKIRMYYDSDVLSLSPLKPTLVFEDAKHGYSAWYKPRGMLAEGTRYGDHCSLLRQVALLKERTMVLPITRLHAHDDGLMLVAHTPDAASKLSNLARRGLIERHFAVWVRGKPKPGKGTVDAPLDGQACKTHYESTSYDHEKDLTLLIVIPEVGLVAKDQIRRHMAQISQPVVRETDGATDDATKPQKLETTLNRIRFMCPWEGLGRDIYIRPRQIEELRSEAVGQLGGSESI